MSKAFGRKRHAKTFRGTRYQPSAGTSVGTSAGTSAEELPLVSFEVP